MVILINCGVCEAASGTAYICAACRVMLADIITRAGITVERPNGVSLLCVLDELDVQMSRQSRAAPRYGGRSAETPIPFDSRAAKAHSRLSHLLTLWARRYGAPDTVLAGPRRCAAWLHYRLGLVVLNPDVVTMYRDIDAAITRALLILDHPEPKDYIGICSSVTDGVLCKTDLYAMQGAPTLTCQQCGATHDVGGRRAVMLEVADDLLLNGIDIARIASVTGVAITAGAIYRWRFRGRLIPRGTNAKGHPMYRLGDVLELARGSVLR